jgi:predicted heme/steroid binding protein
MNKKELAQYDGKEGRKAYVAVNDLIYDVTDSPLWQNGEHEGEHQAGRELTKELRNARHVQAVLKKFPMIAYLDDDPAMSPELAHKTNNVIFFVFLVIAAIGGYLLLK